MKNENGAGAVILSFLVGGIVGAGVALLLAPRSGRETREKVKAFAGGVLGKAGPAFEGGKDYFEEKKARLAAAIAAGKEVYEQEKEKSGKEQQEG